MRNLFSSLISKPRGANLGTSNAIHLGTALGKGCGYQELSIALWLPMVDEAHVPLEEGTQYHPGGSSLANLIA
jgi:hypothetical protein